MVLLLHNQMHYILAILSSCGRIETIDVLREQVLDHPNTDQRVSCHLTRCHERGSIVWTRAQGQRGTFGDQQVHYIHSRVTAGHLKTVVVILPVITSIQRKYSVG
uniref:Putative secreted protein n=1 Tax=Anopheles marajoara TaxID=58244 RepID=A0A2M4C8L1_9DIPT